MRFYGSHILFYPVALFQWKSRQVMKHVDKDRILPRTYQCYSGGVTQNWKRWRTHTQNMRRTKYERRWQNFEEMFVTTSRDDTDFKKAKPTNNNNNTSNMAQTDIQTHLHFYHKIIRKSIAMNRLPSVQEKQYYNFWFGHLLLVVFQFISSTSVCLFYDSYTYLYVFFYFLWRSVTLSKETYPKR